MAMALRSDREGKEEEATFEHKKLKEEKSCLEDSPAKRREPGGNSFSQMNGTAFGKES